LAGIPRRLGYTQGRPLTMTEGLRAERNRPWFSRRGPRRLPRPRPRYYADLLDLLGLPPVGGRPRLHASPAEEAFIDEWLRARGVAPEAPLVLLNAGASFGASKLWSGDRFAAVARALRDRHGLVPIFLAGPAEVDLVRGIAQQADAVHATDPVLSL